ncbi:hypothetical protein [Nonomuraea soli]|uniref:Uncharacterized protein n=1 Tax=Nonomuraea soli TaxID=1032476 RepID=A0A7W0CPQ3_9ACTN|nr:hypothetical protein [Nonomuraea soli]MBA2895099.1 hypothetical protein [Nonomuraea soli]
MRFLQSHSLTWTGSVKLPVGLEGQAGTPPVYFPVSVSDDALMAFERRGLPLRDAFDSSFDEILRVSTLGYTESRRLLYRRIIGLDEPYVALCHVLSGGLACDLLRTARQLVRLGHALTSAAHPMRTIPASSTTCP